MNARQNEIETLSRRRVRTELWMVAGFIVVLLAIAANDALVRAGLAFGTLRMASLALLAGGALMMLSNLARFIAITRRSLREPQLRTQLWDELASSNRARSMVFAFAALLFALITLAVVSMFTTLSAPWVINALLVTGFGVQAGSFALLERRGDDARE